MKGKRNVFSQLLFVFLGKKFLLSLRKKYSSSLAKPLSPASLILVLLFPQVLTFIHPADQPSTHSSLLHLFIHPPILSSICLSILPSIIHPSIHPSIIHISIHLLILSFTYLSIHHPSILPSFIHPSMYPPSHPPIRAIGSRL